MRRLKRETARQGMAMSELVEFALRAWLDGSAVRAELPPLPVIRGGGELVDIADRDELYGATDGR